jgi:hypothetical protein
MWCWHVALLLLLLLLLWLQMCAALWQWTCRRQWLACLACSPSCH